LYIKLLSPPLLEFAADAIPHAANNRVTDTITLLINNVVFILEIFNWFLILPFVY
jgi:hypothetical protein